jgi:hypothetical protein
MDLLERYVNDVKTFLPKAQQEDIVQELSANLQSQMDDREAELGRPLTEAEQEAILRQHGHPMTVAGRYQSNQVGLAFGRQLIGPTLFPLYLKVLWFNLGITFAIYVIVLVVLATIGSPISVVGVMSTVLIEILIQSAVVTGIFIAVEQYLPSITWNAKRPSALHPAFRKAQQIPRLQPIAEIVALVVLLGWLRYVFVTPSVLFGPAANTYRIGPIWQQVALPVVLIFAIYIAQAIVNLFRPDWTRFRPVTRLVTDFASLAIVIYLFRGNHWVVLAHPNGGGGNALSIINESIYYGLLSMVIFVVIVILIDAWKLIRGEQKVRSSKA